jgi:hypothetical protein
MDAGKAHHFAADDVKLGQGVGEADGLGEPMFGQAAAAVAADVGMQDEGPCPGGGGRTVTIPPPGQEREIVVVIFRQVGNQSSPS